jgi:hypothetical protein
MKSRMWNLRNTIASRLRCLVIRPKPEARKRSEEFRPSTFDSLTSISGRTDLCGGVTANWYTYRDRLMKEAVYYRIGPWWRRTTVHS